MIDQKIHNQDITAATIGRNGDLTGRRAILQGLASYGIMAPTMINSIISDASAGLGSSQPIYPGITRHQISRDDDISQMPCIYPLPFGCHDQASGPPPRGFFKDGFFKDGFFKPDHRTTIQHAFPEFRSWINQNPTEQAQAIHHWFNQAPYRPEPVKRALSLPSVSPASFLRQGGDSEDHAFMRYLALLHLGFHPERLRITALALPASRRSTPKRYLHTVLCVYYNRDIMVLDPWHPDLYSHQNVFGYRLLLMFNHQRRWLCRPQMFETGG